MLESIVQIIGILVAFAFVFLGADDLLWDIYALLRRTKPERIDLTTLDQKPPKMLAIAIAAWHEDAVIGDVVENLLESVNYPSDMYRVFLGVYPNDPATIAVVDRLVTGHSNVVMVVNVKDGPTSKADNLNYTMSQIMVYEKENGIRFAGITVHDSEDIIHPLELKVTNLLIDKHEALQFPVFPLMRMPRLSNFFKTLTVGTYADEFAEHHFRTLSIRDQLGFVPSAGTGFCISRSLFDILGDGQGAIMNEDSLTEDYDLSLKMNKEGHRVHYVLECVPRIDSHGKRRWDYIATRSIFPQKFKLAVRQKTRWIYGITMQTAKAKDIFAKSKLNFRDRTFLYKDLKAKFANLVILPGYLVFMYFLVSLINPQLPIMYPIWSIGWWLCIILAVMMVQRQFLRGWAVSNVYGKKMLFFSCLLPPLFPIRLIWGNIINFCATLRAWKQNSAFKQLVQTGNDKTLSTTKITTKESVAEANEIESNQEVELDSSHRAEAAPSERSIVSSLLPDTNGEMSRDGVLDKSPRQEWSKTDHEFLSKDVLQRYHRRYGDYLLMNGALSEDDLKDILTKLDSSDGRLGEKLLAEGVVGTSALAEAAAAQNNTARVRLTPALMSKMVRFPIGAQNHSPAWLIMETSKGYLAISSEKGSGSTGSTFEQITGKPVFMLVADSSEMDESIYRFEGSNDIGSIALETESLEEDFRILASLCDTGTLTLAQAGIALGYAVNGGTGVVSTLQSMGLIRRYTVDSETNEQKQAVS